MSILPLDLVARVTRVARKAQLAEMARNENNDPPRREKFFRELAKDPELLENNQLPCGPLAP